MAVLGSKVVAIESQLATARYQNQGLKVLLNRVEGKHEEATKQLTAEKSVKLLITMIIVKCVIAACHFILQRRKTQMNIEGIAQKKMMECEQLEKKVNELCAENEDVKTRLSQLEDERGRQKDTIMELSHNSEKTRECLSKNKKKCEALAQGIQSAKRIMAAVLAVINQQFGDSIFLII